MPQQIDEKARRRAEFTRGIPVVLADGQEWVFPQLKLRLSPRRPGPGADCYRVGVGRVGLPRFESWVEAITAATGQVPLNVYWDARMDAAGTLLRLNYELSDDELAELLAWEDDGPGGPSERRWDEIDAAVLGIAPKA